MIVGASLVAAATYEAVVWKSGNLQRLSEIVSATGLGLGGATLTNAVSISGDGKTVIGNANVSGVSRAFIVRLP